MVIAKKKISVKKTIKPISNNSLGKSIMVVDDEQDVRDTTSAVLQKNGYKILTAVSGDDALKQIQGGAKPDLILMDIMMPGTPVKDIIPKLGNIKVAYLSVVRTSEAEKEDLMKSKNIVDFMQKPFDIKNLLSMVKKHLG